MRIEALDLAHDRDLAAVHAVQVACRRVWGDAALLRTPTERASWIRYPIRSEWRGYWVGRDYTGAIAAFAAAGVPTGGSTAGLYDLLVTPDLRHRGLGRALLAAVTEACAARGALTLHGTFIDSAGERFARAVSARGGPQARLSVMPLPVDLPVPPPVPGYRLRSWVGATLRDVLDSYASTRNAINDAPHDADAVVEVWTPGRVRDLEATIARRNQQCRVTVAVDDTGEVAGYSELRVGPESGRVPRTEDTAVAAAHRGRGLARLIKRESLRQLAADRPDVRAVVTKNDIVNAPMLAVNSALGFTEIGVESDAFLPLTGPD